MGYHDHISGRMGYHDHSSGRMGYHYMITAVVGWVIMLHDHSSGGMPRPSQHASRQTRDVHPALGQRRGRWTNILTNPGNFTYILFTGEARVFLLLSRIHALIHIK